MGWLDKFRSAPPSREHVAFIERPFVNEPYLTAHSKRIGM